MSQLSHKKARSLLQKKADLIITHDEKTALEEHLLACNSCHSYDKDLIKLEEKLHKTTNARWNVYAHYPDIQSMPNPTIVQESSRVNYYSLYKDIFVKITVVITLVVAAFFSTQVLEKLTISSIDILSVTPTRTPLAEHIVNKTDELVSREPCGLVQYIVQKSDTLDSIASKFRVSKEQIIEQNQLVLEKFGSGTSLHIPMCTGTPTRTALIPNYTHTTTPTSFIK